MVKIEQKTTVINDKRLQDHPVTYFKGAINTKPVDTGSFADFLQKMLNPSDKLKAITDKLPSKQDDKDAYVAYRQKNLPAVVSGKATKRNNQSIEEHPQILGLDIDDVEEDLLHFDLEELKKIPFVLSAFPSPSMQGIRVFVYTDCTPETRQSYYHEVCSRIAEALQIGHKTDGKFDSQGKAYIDSTVGDLARLWFFTAVPHDLIYIAPQLHVFTMPKKDNRGESSTPPAPTKPAEQNKHRHTHAQKVELMIRKIEEKGIGITQGTENWFKVGCALFSEFGASARDMFQRVSYFHNDYNQLETDREFDRVSQKHDGSVHIATFYEICDLHGIRWSDHVRELNQLFPLDAPAPAPAPPAAPVTVEEPEEEKEDFENKTSGQGKFEEALKEIWEFRFNTISRMPEFRKVDCNKDFEPVNDYELNSITRELRHRGVDKVSRTKVAETIESSFARPINPIEEYFSELVYDGEDHIRQLCQTLEPTRVDGSDTTEMVERYFRKWAVGAVANVFIKHKCANHICFILVSGEQAKFKSSWIANLCPPKLKKYYLEDRLDPDNKDHLFATASNFIYNLDDYFADITKKKINSLKAFITRNTVEGRRAYARYTEELPKICSFIASSNEQSFLHDPTGNRRFVPFEINNIRIDEAQAMDIDKVWAEAYHLYKSGFQYWLTQEEVKELNEHNSQYEVQTTEAEMLTTYYVKPDNRNGEGVRHLKISHVLNFLQVRTSARLSKKKLGEALKANGFEQFQKRDGKSRIWVYAMIERTDEEVNQIVNGKEGQQEEEPF
ncbi:MAG: VapE family protein [Phaeodactylibacter sp.]|uniref:VapE domain-containing protein n=1 Tax=Phaeodactylibacter sp. TaxID=1940289 RepID=UPI0032EB979E